MPHRPCHALAGALVTAHPMKPKPLARRHEPSARLYLAIMLTFGIFSSQIPHQYFPNVMNSYNLDKAGKKWFYLLFFKKDGSYLPACTAIEQLGSSADGHWLWGPLTLYHNKKPRMNDFSVQVLMFCFINADLLHEPFPPAPSPQC